jgi:hypothetical protein
MRANYTPGMGSSELQGGIQSVTLADHVADQRGSR